MTRFSWPRPWWAGTAAVLAILFGLLTIKAGGSVLFVDGPARLEAGHYMPFVVWFNFLAGFFYVIAGIGLWKGRPWAAWLATAIVITTLLVFVAFGVHVYAGRAYEHRTVMAMSLRTLVWVAITMIAWSQLARAGR